MRRDGVPLWSVEPEHCDSCCRELLLGERALLMHRGNEYLLACPLCAERLYAEDYRVVASDTTADGVEAEAPSRSQ